MNKKILVIGILSILLLTSLTIVSAVEMRETVTSNCISETSVDETDVKVSGFVHSPYHWFDDKIYQLVIGISNCGTTNVNLKDIIYHIIIKDTDDNIIEDCSKMVVVDQECSPGDGIGFYHYCPLYYTGYTVDVTLDFSNRPDLIGSDPTNDYFGLTFPEVTQIQILKNPSFVLFQSILERLPLPR